MTATALFQFHDSLNDFLSTRNKNKWISYNFDNNPAIKDSIEAIGIPHCEVDVIVVNGRPVNFDYRLNDNDKVEIYPVNAYAVMAKSHSLTPGHIYPLRFVADVHLGKLAKVLRILGFDTSYENGYADKTVVELAEKEDRIVLTRDIGLLKHRSVRWGYWLRSQMTTEQLEEIVNRYKLSDKIMPFKRCLACNGEIQVIAKEMVLAQVPPKTIDYFNDFFQCSSCKKIYWKGSHYENMVKIVEEFQQTGILKTRF